MLLVQTTRLYIRLAALAVLAVCLAPRSAGAQTEWWRGLRHRTVWVYLGAVDRKTFELTTPPVHRIPDIPGRVHPAIPRQGDLVDFTADVPLRIVNYKRRGERDRFHSFFWRPLDDRDVVTIAPRGTAGVVNEVQLSGRENDPTAPLFVRITPWAPLTDIRGVTDLITLEDPAAMQSAGESGNRVFVPALKAVASRHRYTPNGDDPSAWWSHWALAKLDDRDTLQIFWCSMLRETGSPPVWNAESIGGWFAYQALVAVLDGAAEEAQQKGAAREPVTDIVTLSTQQTALESMIRMATGEEHPDIFSTDTGLLMMTWRDWAVTSEHLRALAPTGEGVDFSKAACEHARPRKRR
jgi:hypothetical protein